MSSSKPTHTNPAATGDRRVGRPAGQHMARLRTGVAAIALIAIGAAGALTLAPRLGIAQSKNSDTYRELSLFGDVFDKVRTEYVEPVSDQDLVENALNGMLSSLDPHSSFLNEKAYQEMQVQTRGEFGGLGIEVTMENGLVKVVSPIDDTPAFRAGVKPGDFITAIDGQPVLGLTLNEAVEKMRGPVNSDIKLTIRREGKDPFDLSVTRAVIKIASVKAELKDDIGYVRVSSFTDNTDVNLTKAIRGFKDKVGDKLHGIVLDLRNDPGGLLDQAVKVSDMFLDKGEIVSTRGRRPEEITRYNAHPGDEAAGLPMVVLINGGSASASEIVAGALQDHHRAIVMGTRSFGKGSVQTIIPLPGRVAIRLTTARYFTPSGRSIQQVGIEPDIEVPEARLQVVDEGKGRREADLRGALSNPNPTAQPVTPPKPLPGAGQDQVQTQPGAKPAVVPVTNTPAPAPGSPDDYQLARAIDLLHGIQLYSSRSGE